MFKEFMMWAFLITVASVVAILLFFKAKFYWNNPSCLIVECRQTDIKP